MVCTGNIPGQIRGTVYCWGIGLDIIAAAMERNNKVTGGGPAGMGLYCRIFFRGIEWICQHRRPAVGALGIGASVGQPENEGHQYRICINLCTAANSHDVIHFRKHITTPHV